MARTASTYGVCVVLIVPSGLNERRHQNRLRADRARLVHVSRHVHAKGRLWIRFALDPFSGLIVVAELNQVVLALGRQCLRPQSFVDKALRAAAVGRDVDDFHAVGRQPPQARPPPGLFRHGRISDEHDAHGRLRMNLPDAESCDPDTAHDSQHHTRYRRCAIHQGLHGRAVT
jgi:hypothetical protein